MCLLDVASCSASHHQIHACVADPCVMAPLLVRLKSFVAPCLAVALCAVAMDVDVCCAVAGVALGAAVATNLCVVEDTCVLAPLLVFVEQVVVWRLGVALRAVVPYAAEFVLVATCVCVVEDTCVLAPLPKRLEQVAVVCLDVALRVAVPYVAESIPVATCVCVSSKYVSDAGAGLLE